MSTSRFSSVARRGLVGLALVAAGFHAPAVRAEAPASSDTTDPTAAETTAPSTADVSGVLVPEPASSSPARALLVAPRLAVTVVSAPLHGGLAVYEEYKIHERLVDFFFNDSRTFGVYPSFAFESGLSPNVGARLVHRNVFGRKGNLRLAADWGGESRYKLQGALASPAVAGGLLRARLAGAWQRQPNAAFFGIGDQDLGRPTDDVRGLPARAPIGVTTHFGQEVVSAELSADIDPQGPFYATVSTAYFGRTFGDAATADPTAPPDVGRTDVRFDTSTLTGWGQGTKIGYSELQVGWNSLTVAGPFVAPAAPSSGTKVAAFVGRAQGVGGSQVGYTRYGADAFRYFDLWNGDRVLVVRGRLEGLAGADDRIPFTDLPRLGGPVLMRGYTRDRFRDRVSVLASIEYRYPIWQRVAGFVFVDGGRVVPDLAEAGRTLLAPQRLRGGGGGGLEILGGDRFLMRGQIAGSPEGFFFQLALEPVYHLPAHNYRI